MQRTGFFTKTLFVHKIFKVSAYFSNHTEGKIELILSKNIKIAKVGSPQISSANRKSANLQTYFLIWGPSANVSIFGFVIFAD